MDPITNQILQGIAPLAGAGSTLERNALIGVIRNLISEDKYNVDYILNYAQSIGYSRQMAEDVFKELTGLSPALIVNNNEYYEMPAFVPNMCIAWGLSKSNKEKAFYIVPFSYGYAVMEKDEVNAPVSTVVCATIPEAFAELKKVAKNIQTLDKIITEKLLEAEDVPTTADNTHQVNLPYSVSPLQVLKKSFKNKVLSGEEFEKQAKQLLASDEITVDEAEDLMNWKQELIEEDDSYANEVLENNEKWNEVQATIEFEDIYNELKEIAHHDDETFNKDKVRAIFEANKDMFQEVDLIEAVNRLYQLLLGFSKEEILGHSEFNGKQASKKKADGLIDGSTPYVLFAKGQDGKWEPYKGWYFSEVTDEDKQAFQNIGYTDLYVHKTNGESLDEVANKLNNQVQSSANSNITVQAKKKASKKVTAYTQSEVNKLIKRINFLDNKGKLDLIDFLNYMGYDSDAINVSDNYDEGLEFVITSDFKKAKKYIDQFKKESSKKVTSFLTMKVSTDEFSEIWNNARECGDEIWSIKDGKLLHIIGYNDFGNTVKITYEPVNDFELWEECKDDIPFDFSILEYLPEERIITKQSSKKVTAENMTLDDIEAEENKDQVQEEIEKIDETPAEDIFSETTPEQYFDDALKEDKVDTINEVVSKCIDKFAEKFKDFDKYEIKILSYNTKVLGDYDSNTEEMVEDEEINANAILQVILQITNNADETSSKKVLVVFSITNGELHWTGTVRGENDQIVAFTEEGLDALFEVNEPSEEELEDII